MCSLFVYTMRGAEVVLPLQRVAGRCVRSVSEVHVLQDQHHSDLV